MKSKWQTTNTRLEDFLVRAFQKNKSLFNIIGASAGTASSYFLSQSLSKEISDLPRLVVISSLERALAFEQQLNFFSPLFRSHVLHPWDVSPFSGLFPSPEVRNSKSNFLYWAARAQKNDIFIVPVSALLQLSSPFFLFNKRCKKLAAGDELPNELASYLNSLGYQSAPVVEDVGQYSLRGGIVDIFSPAHKSPVRLELFGDQLESLRNFSIGDQRSLDVISEFNLVPIYEFDLNDENIEAVIARLREDFKIRGVKPSEVDEIIRSISLKNYFAGCEFLLPYCYDKLSSVLDHFSSELNLFFLDESEVSRAADEYIQEIEADYKSNLNNSSVIFAPEPQKILARYENIPWPKGSRFFNFSNLSFLDDEKPEEERITYSSLPLTEFSLLAQNLTPASEAWIKAAKPKITAWIESGHKIFISIKNQTQVDRLKTLLQKMDLNFETAAPDEYLWDVWLENTEQITLVPRLFPETCLLVEEKIVFLRSDDFFGKKQRANTQNAYEQFSSKAKSLAFGDLKPNDLIVHVKHGIGVYEGLKIMNIGGADSEFIQIAYKDKDKLYLPVYRVGQLQKFSGATQTTILDKLGGIAWEKTKIKVKAHLR
ncbi:MAG: CarD family transcriptional regulator, partial [Pseudobdellovibrio sp.]